MANKEIKQSLEHQIALIDNKTDALKSEISKIRSEVHSRLQPVTDAVVKAESAIIQLQDELSEVSLLLQTLQAASFTMEHSFGRSLKSLGEDKKLERKKLLLWMVTFYKHFK